MGFEFYVENREIHAFSLVNQVVDAQILMPFAVVYDRKDLDYLLAAVGET
tara:strand:+ start:1135 stop:1284 length:150 start_codon:yes stop_codon:yes gene_type:complete